MVSSWDASGYKMEEKASGLEVQTTPGELTVAIDSGTTFPMDEVPYTFEMTVMNSVPFDGYILVKVAPEIAIIDPTCIPIFGFLGVITCSNDL